MKRHVTTIATADGSLHTVRTRTCSLKTARWFFGRGSGAWKTFNVRSSTSVLGIIEKYNIPWLCGQQCCDINCYSVWHFAQHETHFLRYLFVQSHLRSVSWTRKRSRENWTRHASPRHRSMFLYAGDMGNLLDLAERMDHLCVVLRKLSSWRAVR